MKYLIAKLLFVMIFIATLFLMGCQSSPPPNTFEMQPVKFAQLPNWKKDQFSKAWPAFMRSCQKLKYSNRWKNVCTQALAMHNPSSRNIRKFFETHFTPYQVSSGKSTQGLFTGYYEPVIEGSRERTEKFKVPMYKRPADLVMIEDLGIFRKNLKGVRIAGRSVNGRLKPYYTHEEIDNGILAGNEILWIENPVDSFFIQIQGSAAVQLEDGEIIHLSYAGTNGHVYTAIGNVLIEKNKLTSSNISMQSIRAWLQQHPEEAKEILYHNASYVFFDEMKGRGPVGDMGVVLTPGRSLAIDTRYIPHGAPIWLNIEHPVSGEHLQRLVMAQDKGGAIKGPIRGDLFWGTGERAGELAGSMKSKGSYFLLLPKA